MGGGVIIDPHASTDDVPSCWGGAQCLIEPATHPCRQIELSRLSLLTYIHAHAIASTQTHQQACHSSAPWPRVPTSAAPTWQLQTWRAGTLRMQTSQTRCLRAPLSTTHSSRCVCALCVFVSLMGAGKVCGRCLCVGIGRKQLTQQPSQHSLPPTLVVVLCCTGRQNHGHRLDGCGVAQGPAGGAHSAAGYGSLTSGRVQAAPYSFGPGRVQAAPCSFGSVSCKILSPCFCYHP